LGATGVVSVNQCDIFYVSEISHIISTDLRINLMSTTTQNLKSLSAVVTTVINTAKDGSPLMKKRADGSEAPVLLCGLRLTEGPHAGKTLWAQRALVNRDGVAKEPVAKGDNVFATLTSVVDGKPFFEVTTSANASDEDLLSAFGATTEQTVAKTEEVEIPLVQ